MASYMLRASLWTGLILWIVWAKTAGTIPLEAMSDASLERLTLNFYIQLQKYHKWEPAVGAIDGDVSKFEASMRSGRNDGDYSPRNYRYGLNLYQTMDSETFLFYNFESSGFLKTQTLVDLSIFEHRDVQLNRNWCAVAILSKNQNDNVEYSLVLYRFNKELNFWNPTYSEIIPESKSVRSVQTSDGVLLAISKKGNNEELLCNAILVYFLNVNLKLDYIQTLETNFFSDMQIWKREEDTLLTVAADYTIGANGKNFETDNPIFSWKGNHFDIFQYFPTKNARKVISFQIGVTDFIAVANHRNNYGEENIFSEIFKFDPQKKEYIWIQKLSTHSPIDISFFGFQWNSYGEAFLVIVNEYSSSKFKPYYTASIVYKFDGGKFVPFQNIPQENIIKWFSLIGKEGEFVLAGMTQYNNIKTFQYNGWLFEEIKNTFNDQSKLQGVLKISNFILFDYPVLTITQTINDESISTFYKPLFKPAYSLAETKEKIFSWCKMIQKKIEYSSKRLISGKDSKSSMEYLRKKILGKVPVQENTVKLSGLQLPILNTKAVYADDLYLSHQTIQNINKLMNSFYSQLVSIRSVHEIIPSSLTDKKKITISSLRIKHLELSCSKQPCKLLNIALNKINSKNVKYYQNEIFYLNNGFPSFKKIVLDGLHVTNNLSTKQINGKDMESYQKFILSKAEKNGVLVKNTLILNSGISLSGKIVDIRFNDESILLNNQNQNLKGEFFIPRIKTAILETKRVNDLEISSLNDSINNTNRTVDSFNNITKIIAKDVIIRNMKLLSMETIKSSTLKLNGEETIKGNYNVKKLRANQIRLIGDNSKAFSPKNIVRIDEGIFEITRDIHLDRIISKELMINMRLNNINVLRGALDVLLLNASSEQRLTGDKIFENVELMGPINLVGKINKGSLERNNPVSMIEGELSLIGDYVISGDVSVENRLLCEDLMNAKNQSIRQFEQGVKLSDSEVDIPFIFSQPLAVRNMNCDSINEINPAFWIVSNDDSENVISGKKTFIDSLEIKGNCLVSENVGRSVLFGNIMTISDDQEIDGKMFIKNMTAKRLNCRNMLFGEKSLGSLLTSKKNFIIPNETTVNHFATVEKKIFSYNMEISGTVSGYDIEHMIYDTITNDQQEIIMESMNTKEIEILNLNNDAKIPSVALDKILNTMYWDKQISIHGPVYIENLSNVRNVEFGFSIDGISHADFGNSWLLSYGNQTVYGTFTVNQLDCSNGVYIDNGQINHKDVYETFNKAMWKTENTYVNNIIYENLQVLLSEIRLDGYMNYIDVVNDLVLNDFYEHNFKRKTAKKNVMVKGKIYSTLVNGASLMAYCEINNEKNDKTSWIIEGNAFMQEEPKVESFQNVPIKELYNVWYKDSNTVLNQMNYFNTIIFKSDIIFDGLLNGLDLKSIKEKYFSLSLDQILLKSFNISNLQVNTLAAKQGLIVKGYVQGLNLVSFHKDILLKEGTQIILYSSQFENIAGHVNILGNINDKKLDRDMMRFSLRSKKVYGQKYVAGSVRSVDVYAKYIQGIDMNLWVKNSVKKYENTTYYFQDSKTFKMAYLYNLKAIGYVNDRTTEYLLKDNGLQSISSPVELWSKTVFRNITVVESINGITPETMESLVKTSTSSIIYSPKMIASSFHAKNVLIQGLVNNVSLSDTWNAIIPADFYTDRKLEIRDLIQYSTSSINMNKKLVKCVSDVETVQFIAGYVVGMATLESNMGNDGILVMATENAEGYSEIHFFQWKPDISQYVQDTSIMTLYFAEKITQLFSITVRNYRFLYVETYNNQQQYNGIMYTLHPNNELSEMQFMTRPVLSIVKISTTVKACVLFVFYFDLGQVYCPDDYGLDFMNTLNISDSAEVKVMNVKNVTYLIANKQYGIHVYYVTENLLELSLITVLPPAFAISVTDWYEDNILVAAHYGRVLLYRFDGRLAPFKHVSVAGTVRRINLMDVRDSVPLIRLLVTADSTSQQYRLHSYDGFAGFNVRVVQNYPADSVKTCGGLHNGDFYGAVLVFSNGLLFQRVIFD